MRRRGQRPKNNLPPRGETHTETLRQNKRSLKTQNCAETQKSPKTSRPNATLNTRHIRPASAKTTADVRLGKTQRLPTTTHKNTKQWLEQRCRRYP